MGAQENIFPAKSSTNPLRLGTATNIIEVEYWYNFVRYYNQTHTITILGQNGNNVQYCVFCHGMP